jgi:hypothetical protein
MRSRLDRRMQTLYLETDRSLIEVNIGSDTADDPGGVRNPLSY